MASSPAAAWSITACLRYRGGLEIHAAAENVFPGWGRGGERLSFLLRLRRRFRFAVTSQCGPRALAPTAADGDDKPHGFLRSPWARVPRLLSAWRRKKKPRGGGGAAATAESNARRAQATPSLSNRARMPPPSTKTTALCVLAALAVAAASVSVLRLMAGLTMMSSASFCTSWRCVLAKKFVRFLGPPLHEAIWTTILKLVKFLEPSLHCDWLQKLVNLKWLWA